MSLLMFSQGRDVLTTPSSSSDVTSTIAVTTSDVVSTSRLPTSKQVIPTSVSTADSTTFTTKSKLGTFPPSSDVASMVAVTTSDVVSTSRLPTTKQVAPTSVPQTDNTRDRTESKITSLTPLVTISFASVTFDLSPPDDFMLAILLVSVGMLTILGLLCILCIYCVCKRNKRKLTSEEVGPSGGDVDLHVHHNDGFAPSDGYTALQISKKLSLTADATAVSIDKVTMNNKLVSSFQIGKLETEPKPEILENYWKTEGEIIQSIEDSGSEGFVTNDLYGGYSDDNVARNGEAERNNVSTFQTKKLETESKPEILENYEKTGGEILQSIKDSGTEGFVLNDLYERYSDDVDEDRNGEAKRDSEENRTIQHDYDMTSEDESMSRIEFKLPDTIDKMGDDEGNIFNVAYESYDDSGGRRGKEEPGDGFRSNLVYENYKKV
ncbi:hypothetical protein BSL78_22089 [Apostichopus japonicus]|uniref:Uncharacterized protein n=1 Tax=Stichopus japonicus TaxID=307972 RepID=A0A2G8JZA7_STIJA|nr:hypothetical protein BSL78_22089 [Apostichopus japonicus]